jgi:hypothetical protein
VKQLERVPFLFRPIGDHHHDKKPNEPAARRAGAVPAVVTPSGGSGLFDFEKSVSRSDNW